MVSNYVTAEIVSSIKYFNIPVFFQRRNSRMDFSFIWHFMKDDFENLQEQRVACGHMNFLE